MKFTIKTTQDIGKWLKTERKRQKITQKELAGLVGVSERFILELEKGKSNARIGKAFYVLHKLGATIEIYSAEEK